MTDKAPARSLAARGWNKTSLWVVGAVLGLVIVVVAAVLVTNTITNRGQEQQFLDLIDANPQVDPPDTMNDEALINAFHDECEFVQEGWTVSDRMQAAQKTWSAVSGTAKISEKRFIANAIGYFQAAEEICG